MPERSPATAGVLLYPKPAGVTSHDVVARVRRRLLPERGGSNGSRAGARPKVGHAGTLDPFATGLLLVLVGRATRAQRFFMALPKTYRLIARLGWTSDTGDPEGELVQTGRVPRRIELPTGEIWQRPPAYSAVRVAGERLHRRARRGDPVEGEPRRVVVHRAEVLWREGDRVGIELECSAGSYVRQIVAQLGDAYCEQLERTRVGPFAITDASEQRLLPLEQALDFLPELPLGAEEAARVRHGVPVRHAVDPSPHQGGAGGSEAVRLTHGGRLLAIGAPAAHRVKPVVVLDPGDPNPAGSRS